jgi:TonB family protein
MNGLKRTIGVIIALVVSSVLFLLFPALNVLLADREKKNMEIAYEIEAPATPKKQVIKQKQIRQINNSFNMNASSPSRPSTFSMDLSLASAATSGVGVVGGDAGMMVFNPNEVDEVASPLFEVPPRFPGRAQREGIAGRVELMLVVETNGSVSNIQLVTEEPKGFGFAKEAMAAMSQFKFKPSVREGVPVRQRFKKEFLFEYE